MKKRLIICAGALLITSSAFAENDLQELLANKEKRKSEIDTIALIVDEAIHMNMKEAVKIIDETKAAIDGAKHVVSERLKAIKKIIEGLGAVDFRVKELYAEKIKEIEALERFLKEN
jgi:chromosome segregation ATPase